MANVRAASDVGGTFTDLVYFEIDQHSNQILAAKTEKAHTTPPNFEQGVTDTLNKAQLGFSDVSFFAHGTTVVINALTERKGVKTALITTEGFRDILEIARGNRPDFFNLQYQKPTPFIPRHLRFEISERMDYKGKVLQPLQLEQLPALVRAMQAEEVQAIAISLMHAYANPAHEQAIAQAITQQWPQISVVCSHQLSRQWREYERTNTTALCAYVQPSAEAYLSKLEDKMTEQGFNGAFYVMQSNGGIDTVTATKKAPISIVESGPASGVLGAKALGDLLGIENILAFDIGGTTAKCSLINNGQVSITSEYYIERSATSAGYPIMTPVVDIVEIGNGGGSIGWVDKHGKMHVGPQSAGALPGPVAYGKGGNQATTTDANLMLGRINPDYFIGGEIQADMPAVTNAFQALGDKLGMSAMDAARGVIRIANNNMTNALKLVSVNRGYDPRDFAMVAFGGGGAMHATALAAELNIPTVIIPAFSAVFSAWGMLMSDLRRDYIRTLPMQLHEQQTATLFHTFNEMEQNALSAYQEESIGEERIRIERALMMRYQGQEHTVRVPVAGGTIDQSALTVIIDNFKQAYEQEYTYRLDNPVEVVSFAITAYASVARPELKPLAQNTDIQGALKGSRQVDFDQHGVLNTPFYDREKLGQGARITGPAIVEEAGTTTVIFPKQQLRVDRYGNLHISINGKEA